ncbi:MAG: hypothetical protein HY368_01125 [Candidatus Aenigmarchaeota archaeon]|nr:hypothetical protein [Candidatus Aenigmarchaeota archaeon]
MSKDFKPQDYFRYKKTGSRWQKPRGKQSKLRKSKKGAGRMPGAGYRTPKKFRGLERGVIKAVVVESDRDLAGVGENEAIIISAALGKRKIYLIASAARQRGIKILNMKSAEAAAERQEEINKRKEGKAKKHAKPEEPKKEKEKAEEPPERKSEKAGKEEHKEGKSE